MARLAFPPSARLLALFVLCASLAVAHAQQVYKCTDAEGKTTYSDAPCAAGARPHKLPDEPTKGTGTSPRACEQMLDETRRLAAEADRIVQRGGKEAADSLQRRQKLTRQYESRCAGISRSSAK
jgi:hypothetical protein